jgi:hypothetical protein
VFEAIARGVDNVPEIVEEVYAEVDRSLHPLAARSVDAHVTLLIDQERITLRGDRLVVVSPNR